jgi:hypothetical protein
MITRSCAVREYRPSGRQVSFQKFLLVFVHLGPTPTSLDRHCEEASPEAEAAIHKSRKIDRHVASLLAMTGADPRCQ